jgi:hypothetical protein
LQKASTQTITNGINNKYINDNKESEQNLVSGVYIYRMVSQNPISQNYVQGKKVVVDEIVDCLYGVNPPLFISGGFILNQ